MEKQKNSSLIRIGKNIRELRSTINLSQENLADLSNLDRSYIGGIERGERNITILSLLKIARALDCTFDDLLKGVLDE